MPALIDEKGRRYGNLTVLRRAVTPEKKAAYWRCSCKCGKETIVNGSALRNGSTTSCGCVRDELASERMARRWAALKDWEAKHGPYAGTA